MSASERNALYHIAAVGGVVVGALLLAGAWGHFAAVWDRLIDPAQSRLALLAPGILLLSTGVINLGFCVWIWRHAIWAQRVALAANLIAAGYFAYLLSRGVPNHPIGLFLAVVGGHTIILASISIGLRWPAASLVQT
ncbi:MAG: hypothetical protein AAGJ86_06535 [Pseudomonadota bacterium]